MPLYYIKVDAVVFVTIPAILRESSYQRKPVLDVVSSIPMGPWVCDPSINSMSAPTYHEILIEVNRANHS